MENAYENKIIKKNTLLKLLKSDNVTNSIIFEPVTKRLETGFIKIHFLISNNFIIKFKVLYGHHRNFVESISIYDSNFRLFKHVYRLRNIDVTKNEDQLKELLKTIFKDILIIKKDREQIDNIINELFIDSKEYYSIDKLINIIVDKEVEEDYLQYFKEANF